MPVACFYNFSEYEFIGRWGGEDQAFAPKSKTYMPAFLAQHFAKHLVNRELHRMGLDHATSPKNPEDQPEFNKLFRTAYIRERSLPGQKRNTLKDMIDAIDKNMKASEIAGVPDAPIKDNLGPDVEAPIVPREVDEKEDPNYLPEEGGGAEVPATAGPRSSQPQIVDVPEDDDDEDGGYEGVEVPGPAASTPAAPTGGVGLA